MEAAAEKSKASRDEFVALVEDEGAESDGEAQPEYIFMELKSTTSFKDIDIDAMLEHTTFDEFMKGLYQSKVAAPEKKGKRQPTEFEAMWSSVMQGPTETEQQEDLRLTFETQSEESQIGKDDSAMESKALANIRERRKRMQQSQIFDGSEKTQTVQQPKDLEN